MNQLTPAAKVFVSLTVLAGATVLLYGLIHLRPASLSQFFVLLALAVVASRLRVKLPGVNGTLSVNLPFFLIATVRLSVPEALVIVCVGTLAQSLGARGSKPVQISFNAAALTIAVELAALAFATALQYHLVMPVAIVAAAAAYCLGNTILMMLVLWLAEGASPLPTWTRMVTLTYPYYLLSATIAAMVCGGVENVRWTLAIVVFVAMFFTYRSYRVYFARPGAEPKDIGKGAGS